MQVGDKIEVVGLMHDDSAPPPIGTTGTIDDIYNDMTGRKVHVKWDGDVMAVRTLILPHDRHVFRLIKGEQE